MNRELTRQKIVEAAANLLPELIRLRRHFHQNPELGRQEKVTTAYVLQQLQPLGLEIVTEKNATGLWADLVVRPGEKFLALRADIDALPMTEQNETDYASKNPGLMHACGHDAHTTVLLGAARVLRQIKDEINGNIRFIFQPAEEVTPGGAIDMIERGVLQDVQSIIGLHVDTWIPVENVGIKFGPFMASTDIFRIKIRGVGCHAANPHKSIDPILVASQFVTALQHIVSRNVRPVTPAVVTVTRMSGGTAINIIPEEVEIWGSLRALDKSTRQFLRDRLHETLVGTCQMHGATFEFKIDEGAPPTFNHEKLSQLVFNAGEEILGNERMHKIPNPDMGAEDFAWYLNHVPGVIFRLGTRGRPGTDFELHHPRFDIDERALATGVKMFCWSALRYFANNES